MQKIKRLLILLMCVALFLTVGCQQKEIVQYDGDVTAVVNRETDYFVQPVSDEELEAYYSKVNEMGYLIFQNNGDKNILFSPTSVFNLMLDASEVVPSDFNRQVEEIIPTHNSYYPARDYVRNIFDSPENSRTLWVTDSAVGKINLDSAQTNLFNAFDFYIVSKDSNRKDEMNSYVNEKLGANLSLVNTRNSNQCEVLEINNEVLKMFINCNNLSYRIKNVKTAKTSKQINYLIAENVICKFAKYGSQRILEFETDKDDVVIDIIFNLNSNTTVRNMEYDKFCTAINNIDNATYTTIGLMQIPITTKSYNFSSAQCLKTIGAGFVFEEVDNRFLNTETSLRINQMNEICNLKTSYEKTTTTEAPDENFIQDINIGYSYAYIIRNKTTGLFMYMGTCDF